VSLEPITTPGKQLPGGLPENSTGLVWLDGDIGPIELAKVPLEDRGFMFADGVYEVMRAYGGHIFALEDHLKRLERSAVGIHLDLPLAPAEVGAIAQDLLARTGLSDAELYIQVTRGSARRNHLFPANTPARLLVWARAPKPSDPTLWERGCRVITVPDERWANCDLKTIALLPNVLAKQRAHEAGAFEALLLRDGLLTEGSASNVFLVRQGELITPIADRRILPGISRAHVLQLAQSGGVSVSVRDVKVTELAMAQEILITSTSLELLSVVMVNGVAVGAGKPGPLTCDLASQFAAHARTALAES
jgi:D-alanine transaminase